MMNRRSALKRTGMLAGATIAMPTMVSLLESCKREVRLDWIPEFFTQEEARTVAVLVDMILPRTDTPGALDVKVDIFLDKVFARTYDKKGQQFMKNELEAFSLSCKEQYGDVFAKLSNLKRKEVLEQAEKSNGKFNPGVWGKTVGEQQPIGFYRSIKAMAIWAYLTSEEIGERVLSYDPIPGNYHPCLPIDEVGNKWSL